MGVDRAQKTDRAPLELELPSDATSVGAARHAARNYAEGAGADAEAVSIAVSEAVGNAVRHGYRNGRDGVIRLQATLNGDGLLITVADCGKGMSPHPGSGGLGVGLSLIGRVSDGLEIHSRPDAGTRLRMRFLSGRSSRFAV